MAVAHNRVARLALLVVVVLVALLAGSVTAAGVRRCREAQAQAWHCVQVLAV